MKQQKQVKKRVVLHPRHARPYRKRHYALLLTMFGAAFVLFGLAVSLQVQMNAGQIEGRNFMASLVRRPVATAQAVNSSYGFSFSFDPQRYTGIGYTGSIDQFYTGSDLTQSRPYSSVVLTNKAIIPFSNTTSWLSVEYGSGATINRIPGQVAVDSQQVTVHGINFVRTNWIVKPASDLGPILTSHFVTYQATVQGQTLLIRSGNQFGSAISDEDIDALVHSFALVPATSIYQEQGSPEQARLHQTTNLLNQLLFSDASAADSLGSEGISALYAPAVVKIYNAYCMDIQLADIVVKNACDGVTGSGFFIGSDGVIATNGHVATDSPKDLVIQAAYNEAVAGDGSKLVSLAKAAHLNLEDLAAMTDNNKLLDTIFDAVYNLPDSDFVVTNAVQNLLVGLDSKDPDLTKLVSMTQARQHWVADNDIIAAKQLASDYRKFDGLVKYRSSDVALLKVEGSNYPVVSLGELDEVSQGSNISILGYPVAASQNVIVAKDVSEVTLTSGKVSAIKEANGDNRRLIETDTTIGHGNSGGPVFSDSGHVVGIATYTIDGSGTGDGTFNYVRDIADLQALATQAGVHFSTTSQTQTIWQQAIAAFDSAHYKKALTLFEQVRALYPQHPSLNSFQTRAEANIAAGREARDLPLLPLIAGAVGALLLAGLAISLIIRHHGHHQLYKVSQGSAVPAVPYGAPAHQLHHS